MRRFLVICLALIPVAVWADEATVAKHRRAIASDRLTPDQSVALLQAVAADLNRSGPPYYGLLQDRGGNHCGAWECDILCTANGHHWDVLIDAADSTQDGPDGVADGIYFGTARPAWTDKGAVDPSRCELFLPTEPPPPTDEGGPSMQQQLDVLRGQLTALQQVIDDYRLLSERIEGDLLALKAHTHPEPPVVPCTPVEIETSRGAWHTHRVKACQ